MRHPLVLLLATALPSPGAALLAVPAPNNVAGRSAGVVSRGARTAAVKLSPRRPRIGTVVRVAEDNDVEDPSYEEREPQGRGPIAGILRWWRDEGKEDLQIYATSLFFALVIRLTILEPRYIPSLSMFPTFEVGDQLAVEKVSKLYRPISRKDVVVFRPPEAFAQYSARTKAIADEALIKRVVAVEGDCVQVKNGLLLINGDEQFEEYVFEEPDYDWGPMIVPDGMVMVLGDNRNHSLDSHIWGFLPRENVIGRAIFKYWPPWRVGGVEQ